MLKKFLTLSAFLLISMMSWVSSAEASGKMEVPLGGLVTLEAEDVEPGADYKWVVTKDGAIVDTQSNAIFSYSFDLQGEYIVNLAIDDGVGNIKNTTVSVMAGGRYSKPNSGSSEGVFDVPLAVDFSTLPAMDANNTVKILGSDGRVAFAINPRPDVLEYRIDRNIYEDSDGNGIPDDDVDNSASSAYLLGGIWDTTYSQEESNQIAALITIVTASGSKASEQVNIEFAPETSGTGDPIAVLDTLPATDSTDNNIYVYDEKDTVAFYSRRSEGEILEYRIDKNILVDSDADGDPANDIDNLNDPSFETGGVWVTEYEKSDEQIIAQLIAVGTGGVGSKIQREVIFTERPEVAPAEGGSTAIRLESDKDSVQRGDLISFSVEGLTQSLESYTFDWDFDGDGEVDQIIEGDNQVTYIYDNPGIKQASVLVMDENANAASFSKEIQVNDIAITNAAFDYQVEGNTVGFINNSTVSAELDSQALIYRWSFGDPDEENYLAQEDQITLEDPSYTYLEAGTYVVTLTVTDSAGEESTQTTDIEVGQNTSGEEVIENQTGDTNGESGSLIGRIAKIILYIILGILLLLLLIVGGTLIGLKIKNPDLVFEELIDELKIKLLGILGLNDEMDEDMPMGPEAGVTGGKIPPYQPTQKKEEAPQPEPVPKPAEEEKPKAPEKPIEAQKEKPVAPTEPIPEPESNGPVPDWLKSQGQKPTEPKNEVIEGEVVEEKKPEPTPTEKRPNSTEPKKPNEQKPPESPASAAPATGNPASSTPPAPTADFSDKPADGPSEDLSQSDGPVPDWLKKS